MIDIKDYGYNYLEEDNTEFIPGRIIAVYKGLYKVITNHGEVNAKLKSNIYYKELSDELFPVVGDFVLLKFIENSESLIVKTLERKSYFSRRDPQKNGGTGDLKYEQGIVANFDYVFIMCSLNYDFNLRRIERYLTISWQSGGIPVILLTKSDLVDDYSEKIRAVCNIAIGVSVIAISSKTGEGLEQISEYLKPKKTIVFLGSSGVGKSSLVNALAGFELMKVNDIREDDSKGRHTTTHRQLVLLDNKVMIIDTPGMRTLGMWDVSEGLGETFLDIEELFYNCKFSDCKHINEPGCAVLYAIKTETLNNSRWQNYLKLKREAKFLDKKANKQKQIKPKYTRKNKYKDF